jgi:hypothetical protein
MASFRHQRQTIEDLFREFEKEDQLFRETMQKLTDLEAQN